MFYSSCNLASREASHTLLYECFVLPILPSQSCYLRGMTLVEYALGTCFLLTCRFKIFAWTDWKCVQAVPELREGRPVVQEMSGETSGETNMDLF